MSRKNAETLSPADLGVLVRAGRVRGPAATLARLAKTGAPKAKALQPRLVQSQVTVVWDAYGGLVLAWPMRLYSESNQRDTWEHIRRKKAQRRLARTAVAFYLGRLDLPAIITITRIGKRRLDDDNLYGACKHVRDGIADAFGVDDADERYTWRVRQRVGKDYQVKVEINTQCLF